MSRMILLRQVLFIFKYLLKCMAVCSSQGKAFVLFYGQDKFFRLFEFHHIYDKVERAVFWVFNAAI